MNFENQTDLLGMPLLPGKRINDKPESAALVEVLQALRHHPAVCWCERMNSGAARIGNRFVKFGFTGCPDVLGQLNDGRASCALNRLSCWSALLALVAWRLLRVTAGTFLPHWGRFDAGQ